MPELLAPAGSWEAMLAAVAAGADAIYLGGKRFNARLLAGNFGDEELERAIAYCHARDVKVYVAVNTLIPEGELDEAIGYIARLYEMGADAVLLQDVGLAHLAREIVPDLHMHASTQMTIHSIDGIRAAAEMGFERVVLARELSHEEIAAMGGEAGKLGIGLEIFIHGALCFSYSGQCLLSMCMGGRSSNRGVCAQPCRKRYTLTRVGTDEYGRLKGVTSRVSRESHLLSTRDLCTYRMLDRIARLPVVSLKIEGRMKSPEYVATVVDVYRRGLDALAAGEWSPDTEDERRLLLAFNRRFTRGLIFGATDAEMIASEMAGHRGMRIGKVVRQQGRQATVRLEVDVPLSKGDGVVFRNGEQECGFSLEEAPIKKGGEIAIRTPCELPAGSRMYLLRSARLEGWAHRLMERGVGQGASLPLELEASWDAEGHLVLDGSVRLRDGRVVTLGSRAKEPAMKARDRPLGEEEIERHLCRGISEPFRLARFGMRYSGGLFMPLSALNRARREFLEQAMERIVESRRPSPSSIQAARARLEGFRHLRGATGEASALKVRPRLGIVVDTPLEAIAALEGGADLIYLELPLTGAKGQRCGASGGDSRSFSEWMTAQEDVLRLSHEEGRHLFWKWPRIARDAAVELLLSKTAKNGIPMPDGLMAESSGIAGLARRMWPRRPLHGFIGLNVWNTAAIGYYSRDFEMLTLSPELSLAAISDLMAKKRPDWPQIGVMVQGSLEAMVSEICLLSSMALCRGGGCRREGEDAWALRDEMGRLFPLAFDAACDTRIYNSVETCLIDAVPEFWSLGVDTFLVDARGRGERYAKKVSSIYHAALRSMLADMQRAKKDIAALKEEIKAIARGGITKGPLLSGLKEGEAL